MIERPLEDGTGGSVKVSRGQAKERRRTLNILAVVSTAERDSEKQKGTRLKKVKEGRQGWKAMYSYQ